MPGLAKWPRGHYESAARTAELQAPRIATLQTGHDEIEAGLTVSIGKWWDDSDSAMAERRWVYMKVWPSGSGSGFEMQIEEPEA
jgi:hypothetical protein